MHEFLGNIVQLFLANPLAQSVGFVAFGFQLFAFLNKNDKNGFFYNLCDL